MGGKLVAALVAAVTVLCVGVPVKPAFLDDFPLQPAMQASDGGLQGDSVASVMSEVVAIQAQAAEVVGASDLIASLLARLDALKQSTLEDEKRDIEASQERVRELQRQLQAAHVALSATPDEVRDMEAVLRRSYSVGNDTAQNIESMKALKERFEKEIEEARLAADNLRQAHHSRLEDIDSDLRLLSEITTSLTTAVGCSTAMATKSMHRFLSQLHSAATPSAFLDITAATEQGQQEEEEVAGCCVSYGLGAFMKPCCFKYADDVVASRCESGLYGSRVDHHAGLPCSLVKNLYENASLTDPCTEQHSGQGREYCNDPLHCGDPAACDRCQYDDANDHCFTESCETRLSFVQSQCTVPSTQCFSTTPSSACCSALHSMQLAGCAMDHDVCGVALDEHANTCILDASSQVGSVCTHLSSLLSTLVEDLQTARAHEDVVYGQQMSELSRDRQLLEANLQKAISELEMLQLTAASVAQRTSEYEYQLYQMTHVTAAEAELLVVSLPQRIEEERRARQERKERRERELGLIGSVQGMVGELTSHPTDSSTPALPDASTLQCWQFNRPGYYYHPTGVQPSLVVCPHDTRCAMEKVLINPSSQPLVFLVRMGCYSDLVADQGCGSTTCSSSTMYRVECCTGDKCNAPDGTVGSRSYLPGQCNPDTCECDFVGEYVKPSPYPSASAAVSPSPTITPTVSSTPTASPSLSSSVTPSVSPSPSPFAASCAAIKAANPNAQSGTYSVLSPARSTPITVQCDMDTDNHSGFALVWKNVGGTLTNTSDLVSNADLLSSERQDVVSPPLVREESGHRDVSQFNSPLFNHYASLNNTEWVKIMALYEGSERVRVQAVKVVMEGVSMGDVLFGEGEGHCVPTRGSFSLYSTERGSDHALPRVLGRTTLLSRGHASSPRVSYGLATQQEGKCIAPVSNLITDTSALVRLADDLQLGSNEAWGTIEHLFSYDHEGTNPRDFSRCMFRCWDGHDGDFHETFVWGVRQGCPGFLFHTNERCSGHGVCMGNGVCECDEGWTGPGCAAKRLTPTCGNAPPLKNGVEDCQGDRCDVRCKEGYVLDGPSSWDCSDDLHWRGANLSKCLPVCDFNCSSHGVCLSPDNCRCDPGWVGSGCEKQGCITPLSSVPHAHVTCSDEGSVNHTCTVSCLDGYAVEGESDVGCKDGVWADIPRCEPQCPPDQCSRHGKCLEPGVCECFDGFKGAACELPDCRNVGQCSEHGLCVSHDVCLCDNGWDGAACDLRVRDLDAVALLLTGASSQTIELPAMGEFKEASVEWWMHPSAALSGDDEPRHVLLQPAAPVDHSVRVSLVGFNLVVDVESVQSVVFKREMVLGVWTHVALVFSGFEHSLTLFVNGEQVEQVSLKTNDIVLAASRLGGISTPAAGRFKGFVKELRVWRTARSAAQVATNAHLALTGTDEQLEALYPLSGPLSANTVFLDDLSGKHSVRVIGGQWALAPSAPPGPQQLPYVFHNAPANH